jgi:AAA+ ATPase superfamily predicted ATPase
MNPFKVHGYEGAEYFCNRTKETEELKQNMLNGRNTVVYGWRRLGKSALIWHVLDKLKKQKFACIYADLYGTNSIAEANEAIVDAIVKSGYNSKTGFTNSLTKLLGSLGATLSFDSYSGMPKINFGITNSNPHTGEQNLNTLIQYIKDNYKNTVVVLDEFQSITEYSDKINPEAIFRGIMQENPQIRFVYSGSNRHLMMSMFSDSNRPFYSSCAHMLIEPIYLEDYTPFIQKWMKKGGIKIEAEHIEQAYNWANGQTFYVQLVCNMLYNRGENVTQEILVDTFRRCIDQQTPYFQNIHEMLTQKQRQIMQAIAQENVVESPTSQGFTNKYGLGATSSISRVINSLESKTLIIKTSEGYRIHDALLSRWYEQL